ncbi:hypothetical protein E2C01_091129 [Portunus trituberculatus]|uniref:Uncharacterized protein n=1 Tax=Portunus trituberculatus TaxID=210409 RepID=A0A5B7JGK3_PORTR|nr:hypothetical protein [Portunus trituberculatus]
MMRGYRAITLPPMSRHNYDRLCHDLCLANEISMNTAPDQWQRAVKEGGRDTLSQPANRRSE